jgi:hypothetical protein
MYKTDLELCNQSLKSNIPSRMHLPFVGVR